MNDAPDPSNVVSIEARKSSWTPEECLAVVARRSDIERICIVTENADGSSSVFTSAMVRKDLLWLAEQAREAALCRP